MPLKQVDICSELTGLGGPSSEALCPHVDGHSRVKCPGVIWTFLVDGSCCGSAFIPSEKLLLTSSLLKIEVASLNSDGVDCPSFLGTYQ